MDIYYTYMCLKIKKNKKIKKWDDSNETNYSNETRNEKQNFTKLRTKTTFAKKKA